MKRIERRLDEAGRPSAVVDPWLGNMSEVTPSVGDPDGKGCRSRGHFPKRGSVSSQDAGSLPESSPPKDPLSDDDLHLPLYLATSSITRLPHRARRPRVGPRRSWSGASSSVALEAGLRRASGIGVERGRRRGSQEIAA